MIFLPWIIENSSWLIPAVGWIVSEIQGWKSGGKSASVSQIAVDAIKEAAIIIKNRHGGE